MGGLVGLALFEEPEPCKGLCFEFGPEDKGEAFLLGAMVGGLLGGLVGFLAGSVESDVWKEVPLDRLRVNLAPQRNGRFGFGASVRF